MTKTTEFNSCAKLANAETLNTMNALYDKLKKDGVSPFDYILRLQNLLQLTLLHVMDALIFLLNYTKLVKKVNYMILLRISKIVSMMN